MQPECRRKRGTLIDEIASGVVTGGPFPPEASPCEIRMGIKRAEKWIADRLASADTPSEHEEWQAKLHAARARRQKFECRLLDSQRRLRKEAERQECAERIT